MPATYWVCTISRPKVCITTMAPKVKAKAKAKAKAVLQAPANVIQLNAQQLHAQHGALLEAPPYSQCEGKIHGNLLRDHYRWHALCVVYHFSDKCTSICGCSLHMHTRAHPTSIRGVCVCVLCLVHTHAAKYDCEDICVCICAFIHVSVRSDVGFQWYSTCVHVCLCIYVSRGMYLVFALLRWSTYMLTHLYIYFL